MRMAKAVARKQITVALARGLTLIVPCDDRGAPLLDDARIARLLTFNSLTR